MIELLADRTNRPFIGPHERIDNRSLTANGKEVPGKGIELFENHRSYRFTALLNMSMEALGNRVNFSLGSVRDGYPGPLINRDFHRSRPNEWGCPGTPGSTFDSERPVDKVKLDPAIAPFSADCKHAVTVDRNRSFMRLEMHRSIDTGSKNVPLIDLMLIGRTSHETPPALNPDTTVNLPYAQIGYERRSVSLRVDAAHFRRLTRAEGHETGNSTRTREQKCERQSPAENR